MYNGVNIYTVLPKCLLVSSFAFAAISSKNGSAAGDNNALNSSIPQVSLSNALLTSKAVYLS